MKNKSPMLVIMGTGAGKFVVHVAGHERQRGDHGCRHAVDFVAG
jgi:hypothetical protein